MSRPESKEHEIRTLKNELHQCKMELNSKANNPPLMYDSKTDAVTKFEVYKVVPFTNGRLFTKVKNG